MNIYIMRLPSTLKFLQTLAENLSPCYLCSAELYLGRDGEQGRKQDTQAVREAQRANLELAFLL
jgi:hypothetical protein